MTIWPIIASMFDNTVEMTDALTSVVTAPIITLSADELLTELSKVQQLESVLAARKAELMVAVHCTLSGPSADLGHQEPRLGDRLADPAERRWSGDVLRSVSDEIGLALGAHRKTAARWLNQAALLVDRFPTTLDLLRRGGLPAAAAHHIARELAIITDDDLRGAVEQIVHVWGRRYGWAKIKQIAMREARKVVAEYDSLLHAQRQDERTTYTKSHDGGMADLIVSTSAIDITAIMAALTLRCRELQQAGDPRSMDQLRTDLAVHRLLGQDQTGAVSPTSERPTPHTESAPVTEAASHTGDAPDTATDFDSEPWWAIDGPADDVVSSAEPDPEAEPATVTEPDPGAEPVLDGEAVRAAGDGSTAGLDGDAVRAAGDGSTAGLDTAHADAARVVTEAPPEATDADATASEAGADLAGDTDSDERAGSEGDVGGSGMGFVLPESGLNPVVAAQVVIHCTYAEAVALATGAICTGGELEGYGGLPQDALAMAFTRARFRYHLTDKTPKSDPGRYTPSPGLDQHVRDRDRTCRFPGCNAPVQYCDLDHRVPFPQGPTDEDNLGAFCRHHHRLKHHGNWQVYTTDTGTLVFISPTGRAYINPPITDDPPAVPGRSALPDAA